MAARGAAQPGPQRLLRADPREVAGRQPQVRRLVQRGLVQAGGRPEAALEGGAGEEGWLSGPRRRHHGHGAARRRRRLGAARPHGRRHGAVRVGRVPGMPEVRGAEGGRRRRRGPVPVGPREDTQAEGRAVRPDAGGGGLLPAVAHGRPEVYPQGVGEHGREAPGNGPDVGPHARVAVRNCNGQRRRPPPRPRRDRARGAGRERARQGCLPHSRGHCRSLLRLARPGQQRQGRGAGEGYWVDRGLHLRVSPCDQQVWHKGSWLRDSTEGDLVDGHQGPAQGRQAALRSRG
mmetsp:Transcript_9572/g.26999  ORF Transcript_9572/g.26999 Transcript_9572/m.26999 type:complete len:290 (-) Transcript_9572:96-965(-)